MAVARAFDAESGRWYPVATGQRGPQGSIENGITVVRHGTDADTARPEDAALVWWVGETEPTNAEPDDVWREASA